MSKVILTTANELEDLIQESLRKVLSEKVKDKSNHIEDVLTVSQASAYLCLAKQTLYGLTSRNQIPHFKRGKKLYFKKSLLEEWITQGRKITISELKQKLEQNENR